MSQQLNRWGVFAQQHVEKAALALAALILVGFAWQAVSPHPAIVSPQQLLAGAMGIQERLGGPGQPVGVNPAPIAAYGPLAAPGPLPNNWFRSLLLPEDPTPMPALLSVGEVRVRYDRGAFALRAIPGAEQLQGARLRQMQQVPPGGPPGGPQPPMGPQAQPGAPAGVQFAGRRVAIITALVPIEDQVAAFSSAFGARYHASRYNPPRYAGFRLERSRRVGDQWGPWELLTSREVDRLERQPSSADPASAAHIHPLLTMPLAVRAGQWREDDVVHPQIPTAHEANAAPAPRPVAPPQPQRPPGVFGGNWGPPVPPPVAAPVVQDAPKHLLLRAFDEDVEPEATYRYRVQLVHANPLYETQHPLTAPEMTRDPYWLGPWSMASDELRTPADWEIFAGSVKPGSPSRPATANLLLRQWDLATGATVAAKVTALRGQVLNFGDVECLYRSPSGAVKKAKFLFRTNHMLVDVLDAQPNRHKGEPGQLFLINETGTSSLGRFEDVDRPDYEAISRELDALADEFDLRNLENRGRLPFDFDL